MVEKILLLTLFFSSQVLALVPLEGIIYGDVKDVKQYDPLSNIFSKTSVTEPQLINESERRKFEEYVGLYREGANLLYTCDTSSHIRYNSIWMEETAKRSIVSTLQYIGLDLTIRAIVEYVKLLEYGPAEFDNLVKNLIENNCSKNITIYSLKLLKNNFYHFYHTESGFNLPDIKNSPYFSKNIREKTTSRKSRMNEFNLSIKNFRAFCSWGGGTEDYRLLTSYLKNPFIMGHVFNQILGHKISWNEEQKKLIRTKSHETIKVLCEDLICRRTDNIKFNQKFPKMLGSTDLTDDLKNLYCKHFSQLRSKDRNEIPQVSEWIKKQSIEEPLFESMNFVSLFTGIPELLFSANKYTDILSLMNENINSNWTSWAKEKNDLFAVDMLYEESLNIDLAPMAKSDDIYKGRFQIIFDYTLGELDRVLNVVDKISAKFHLEFPKSYLRWIKEDYIKNSNKSNFKGMQNILDKLETYVNLQLQAKRELFLIPLWNEKMGKIITNELIDQLLAYRGNYFADFSHEKVKVPVKFRFGLFALKYLNQKFNAKYRLKTLTFNK